MYVLRKPLHIYIYILIASVIFQPRFFKQDFCFFQIKYRYCMSMLQISEIVKSELKNLTILSYNFKRYYCVKNTFVILVKKCSQTVAIDRSKFQIMNATIK